MDVNAAQEHSFFFSLVKPSPPVNLKAIDFTKESVTLSWEPPTDTGRGKIFGYLLEFQAAGKEEWHKVRKLPCAIEARDITCRQPLQLHLTF